MYKKYKISVVIPCHNEEESLGSVLQAIPDLVDEVIVVDNNSTDSTAEIALQNQAILVKESRVGYGSAYHAGIARASGDIIVGLDGDGQHDPQQIPLLITHLVEENKTIVVGNRISNLKKPKDLAWIRFFGNVFFWFIVRALFGSGITDTQSGMWALFSAEYKKIKVNSLGMAFSQELKVKMKALGGYMEVPISFRERKGVSKLSVKSDGAKNFIHFFKMFLQLSYSSLDRYKVISLLFYLSLFLGICYTILSQDYLPGGDDLYLHIKYSYLYRVLPWEQVHAFSWLQFTFPKDQFVDLWWLFHVLQIPFTYISDLLLAAKISTLLFIGVFIIALIKSLKSLGIKWRPFWVAVIFLGTQHFLFRLALGRPLIINLIFFLATIVVLHRKKYIWLSLIACLFLLNNVGAILLLPMVGIFVIVESIDSRKIVWKPVVYLSVGYVVGLVIHPFFPDNIYLTFVQIYHTQFTSILDKVGVGNEIYPYSLNDYLYTNGVLALAWFGAIIIWIKNKNKDIPSWWILGISGLTFLMSVKSKRFIEYSVPGMTVAVAYVLKPYFDKINLENFQATWKSIWEFKAIFCFSVLMFGALLFWNGKYIFSSLRSSPGVVMFSESSKWIQENTEPGSIVYNTQWDQFPQLFFWNSNNFYILGMDPTFMYIRDSQIYDKWIVVNGEDSEKWGTISKLHSLLRDDFRANYLYIENGRNPVLIDYIDSNDMLNNYFEKRYSELGVTIYKIR